MDQEEIFKDVQAKYGNEIPGMQHASGGIPDTNGPGTSDVDIVVYSQNYRELGNYLPDDTVSKHKEDYSTYLISGYSRKVQLFASDDMELSNRGVQHRNTELELKAAHPNLYEKAFAFKRDLGLNTEETWAKVLGLGDDYVDVLKDTKQTLNIASNLKD